ncbi:NTE family protein [Virgibacillus subterraneus]|uniref:NTE family protein n=1 Tax=Virgibacillus subterraneus TaxID=621109 RepID=A0A1H9E2Q2_9BACI|nr:patatin-like phospholipase family protein [Virgibacillus subterraneus]SEQ19971.1 NTE family protein [Virgibacillus subterraneus]
MNIDGVFSGGGVKAYALIGALKSIEGKGLSFERVAGTSAGAIMSTLIAAGYKIDEIEKLIQDLDMHKLLDAPKWTTLIPYSKWIFLYFQMGLYKGDKLENWLYRQLANKNIYTFNDLQPDYLKVVVSDISLGRLVVIPDDLERVYGIEPKYFSVSKAVRMSAGFPYFFMPKKLQGKSKHKSLIVDGGLLSNFPLWIFESENKRNKRPILGVKLSGYPEQQSPRKVSNALDMFHALFSTMIQAHDARYISKSQISNIMFIPVEHVESMNFNVSGITKEQLIKMGKEKADQFLRYWPK